MPNANSIPLLEILGRSIGKYLWTCPNCGQEHPMRRTPWRRGDAQCERCKSRYQFGLGFNTIKLHDAYIMGKWNSYTANRWKPIGTGFDGSKLYGSVEFECPECHCPQTGYLDYDCKLSCESCKTDFYISLLIYRIPKGTKKVRAPLDSIVKGINIKNETKSQTATM